MVKRFCLMLLIGVLGTLIASPAAFATQFFQSGLVSFSKSSTDSATDPANWDTITDSVAITRGSSSGIYNPLSELFYNDAISPAGTLWLFGSNVQDVIDGTVNLADFDVWKVAHGSDPPSTVNMPAVLYLVDDDAFVDITFTSWGSGMDGNGGAFSYNRAEVSLVPEPSAVGLCIVACGGAAIAWRRRK